MAMKWTSMTTALAVWLALVVPHAALAAGGPVATVQGSYIAVTGSPYRYAAFNARDNTIVNRQQANVGPAVSKLRVSGHYGIPGVDYSGSTTGLSADGRTLILAELPASRPPHTTRLLALDTEPLAVRARLTLPGWSTVDAISPDGRWLYLIHYTSPDISRYEVLAYDLVTRRLLPHPVIDPRDRGEAMTGIPINRVMSADGRWAYTLYLRPSGVPFVHALDTTGRRAVCIDLPSISNLDPGSAHLALSPGGTTLDIDTGGLTRAAIDTHTFTVTARHGHVATAPAGPVARRRRGTRGHGDVPWGLIVLSTAALGMVAVAGGRVARSRHPAGYDRSPDGAAVINIDAQHADGAPADQDMSVA